MVAELIGCNITMIWQVWVEDEDDDVRVCVCVRYGKKVLRIDKVCAVL